MEETLTLSLSALTLGDCQGTSSCWPPRVLCCANCSVWTYHVARVQRVHRHTWPSQSLWTPSSMSNSGPALSVRQSTHRTSELVRLHTTPVAMKISPQFTIICRWREHPGGAHAVPVQTVWACALRLHHEDGAEARERHPGPGHLQAAPAPRLHQPSPPAVHHRGNVMVFLFTWCYLHSGWRRSYVQLPTDRGLM